MPTFDQNPKHIKFRTRSPGGFRVHWVETEPDNGIYHCVGRTEHNGKYIHSMKIPAEAGCTPRP